MINATNQFFLILQKLSKAAPIDLLSLSDTKKGEEAVSKINENVKFFNNTINNLNDNKILTKDTLKNLSKSLKQMAKDSHKLHEILIAISKRY